MSSMHASTPLCDAHKLVARAHGSGAPAAVTAIAAGHESVRSSPSGAKNASVSGKRKARRRLPLRSTTARSFVPASTQETLPAPTPGVPSHAWRSAFVAPLVHAPAVRKTTRAAPPVGVETIDTI